MKALLICDDRNEWRDLNHIFSEYFKDIDLISVTDGASAFEYLLYEGSFSMVFIDCCLKNEDPNSLARSIIEETGDRPIVFLGTKDAVQDKLDASLYVGNDLISVNMKPYDVESLTLTIQKYLDFAESESSAKSIVEISKSDFLPMRIRNFYLFTKVPYDAFLELTSTRFIRVITKDRTYSLTTLQDLNKRNIKFLYLEKTSYVRFLEDSIKKALAIFEKKGAQPEHLISVQISAVTLVQQYIRELGVSDSIIELVESSIEVTKKNMGAFGTLKEFLRIFPLDSGDFAEQAVITSYTCEAISMSIGWDSDIGRRKLGLAAILHDCTLSDDSLPKIVSLSSKEFAGISRRLQDEYREHPNAAAELATQFLGFTEVEFIIREHHELPDGRGFPNGKTAHELTSVSCLFILASNFATLLATNGISRKSIKKILKLYVNSYDVGNFRSHVKALRGSMKGL